MDEDGLNLGECDGAAFKELAKIQKEKLLNLASLSESQLQCSNEIPDEDKGMIRAAAGKARLLVKERFAQFDGLCESNLNPKEGQLPIGPTDLAGFWDMVMIEVKSLLNTFRQLSAAGLAECEKALDDISLDENSSQDVPPLRRTSSNSDLHKNEENEESDSQQDERESEESSTD